MTQTFDTLFTTPLDKSARFSFDEQVVACFPDMIRRSVPGYGQILGMLPVLAVQQLNKAQAARRKHIQVYDLGCSLGAVDLAIAAKLPSDTVRFTAIDLSQPMLDNAKATFEAHYPKHDITFIHNDILNIPYEPCDMVVLNFTLQFLPINQRDTLIKRVYDALHAGGLLVVSEKYLATKKQENDWLVSAHEDFKRANGYSELEISQKRAALEDVLVRETLEAHHARFCQAGFNQSHTWFSYLNFASMVAVKNP